MIIDFITVVLTWILMGLFVAISCYLMSKVNKSNNKKSG